MGRGVEDPERLAHVFGPQAAPKPTSGLRWPLVDWPVGRQAWQQTNPTAAFRPRLRRI